GWVGPGLLLWTSIGSAAARGGRASTLGQLSGSTHAMLRERSRHGVAVLIDAAPSKGDPLSTREAPFFAPSYKRDRSPPGLTQVGPRFVMCERSILIDGQPIRVAP